MKPKNKKKKRASSRDKLDLSIIHKKYKYLNKEAKEVLLYANPFIKTKEL